MAFEERSTHVYRQKRMFSKEELEAKESLCVYEQPAYCVAACPLKLDTKEMIRCMAEGDFAKARLLYEKITPFPHILAGACQAPCRQKCKLSEGGDGIEIPQLEYAAVRYGEKSKAKGMLKFKKKQSVAVAGSDRMLLFLIGELANKNYPVTVFCREESTEEYFASCTSGLGEHAQEDLPAFQKLEIRFVFQSGIDRGLVEELGSRFDVVCASPDIAQEIYDDMHLSEALMYDDVHDLVTGGAQTEYGSARESVLAAAFAAKKAALTVDRLAQKLSPANTRGEEGSCETRLITNTDGVIFRNAVPAGEDGYTQEQAREEAGRCILCHCDECIRGCAYLQHYKKFPRVLTREIYNNVSIIMGDHMMNKPINACSLCGQCTVTCPNGYDMADICHTARQNMVSTGKMPMAPHEFALYDMLFSNNEAFLCRNQPGHDRCRYVFFPGCQASAIAPATVKAAYLDLCERLEGGVALMLGCCGAICDWAGRYEMYGETSSFIDEQLEKLGRPEVIAGCPMCKKELSAHEGISIKGIWDVLLETGLPDRTQVPRRFALHDSCGARGDEKTRNAIRALAGKLGAELVDTSYSGDRSPCCGYGGLTAYANREVAKEMTEKCLERSDLPYISYCMACRDRFAREGRESVHILELVYGTRAGSPPDISEKRYNRLTLKEHLCETLWKETIVKEDPGFEIRYTEEALALMDDRMILKSDVEEVMKSVRETGEAVYDEESGLLLSRKRLGNVTFWVKYLETEKGYLVCRAYSHRMNVEKRLG